MKGLIGASKAAVVAVLVAIVSYSGDARASVGGVERQDWSFDGFFGKFDQMQLQRGWQIYNEVCASCHELKYMFYRNLSGLGYNEDEIKAFASEKDVTDGPDAEGEMFERAAVASDPIVAPFRNENEARSANGGALPPNLSLIVKARAGGLDPLYSANGADYLYALLTGYEEAPADLDLGEGMYYNVVFTGNQIAMVPPLDDGQVEYADGTETSLEQMSKDVAVFLTWAAEPDLANRKQMGLKALIFLVGMTIVMYLAKRRVWSDVH